MCLFQLEIRQPPAEETILTKTLNSSITSDNICDLLPSSLYLLTLSARTMDGQTLPVVTEAFQTSLLLELDLSFDFIQLCCVRELPVNEEFTYFVMMSLKSTISIKGL